MLPFPTLVTLGNGTAPVSAARTWNALPSAIVARFVSAEAYNVQFFSHFFPVTDSSLAVFLHSSPVTLTAMASLLISALVINTIMNTFIRTSADNNNVRKLDTKNVQ